MPCLELELSPLRGTFGAEQAANAQIATVAYHEQVLRAPSATARKWPPATDLQWKRISASEHPVEASGVTRSVPSVCAPTIRERWTDGIHPRTQPTTHLCGPAISSLKITVGL